MLALFLLLGATPAGEEAGTSSGLALRDIIVVDSTVSSCLDRERLANRTASWLGREVADPALQVTVTARHDAIGFELARSGELRAERWLDPAPEDCADLHAALGLAIALAIDAMVLESIGISLEQREAEVAQTPAEPEDHEVPKLEARRREASEAELQSPRRRVELEVDGQALLGVVPTPAFGGTIATRLALVEGLDLRLGLRGAGGLPIAFDDGEAGVSLVTAVVGMCPNRAWGRMRASLCAGLSSGAVFARGRGFEQSRAIVLPFVAFETGVHLSVAVARRVGLRMAADMVAPALSAALDVRDETGAQRQRAEAGPIGAALSLGLVLRLRP